MAEFINDLNSYSGLLALFAAVVPIIIYIIERRNHRKELRDELESMHEWDCFPLTAEERKKIERELWLKKQLKK